MKIFTAAILIFLHTLALYSHDVDLPGWLRDQATVTLDLKINQGKLAVEVQALPDDIMALSKAAFWDVEKGSRESAGQWLADRLRINEKSPVMVSVLGQSEVMSFERWLCVFDLPLPPSFKLKTSFFKDRETPGWYRVYDFLPGAQDPSERAWFVKSDKVFEWPANRAEAAPPPVWGRFFGMGFSHILPWGLDHLLFVAGLCLAFAGWRRLLTEVTAFTLAHSLTLALAATGKIAMARGWVEPVIAFSIVVVALENCRPTGPWSKRWILVLIFGLVHGMGFASVLAETGIPAGSFFRALLAFNLGIELAQIVVVLAVVGLLSSFVKKPYYFSKIQVPLSLVIAAIGLGWIFQRLLN